MCANHEVRSRSKNTGDKEEIKLIIPYWQINKPISLTGFTKERDMILQMHPKFYLKKIFEF